VAQASPAIVATNSADPVAPLWHTVLFVLIFLALGVADALRIQHTPGVYPHRMRTYIFSIAFEWGMVAYVWWFGLRPRGKLMSDLIGGRWARLSDFFRDVGVAFLFWLVVVAMLIMSRFLLGPNPAATKAIKLLSPRTGAEMIVWVLVSVTAGITEEFFVSRIFAAAAPGCNEEPARRRRAAGDRIWRRALVSGMEGRCGDHDLRCIVRSPGPDATEPATGNDATHGAGHVLGHRREPAFEARIYVSEPFPHSRCRLRLGNIRCRDCWAVQTGGSWLLSLRSSPATPAF
jgi:hypothetical protein